MRYLLLSSLLALGFAVSAQIPDYVPTEGLVAWWDMNGDGEDSGPFQINPVNNGYLSGADRFGNVSGAFNSNDTHINYGVHPEIQNESFSFAAWINPTTPSGAAHRTLMGYHNDADGGATLGLLPDSRVKFHTNHWQYEGLASSEPIIAGTWAHLVGTYSQGVLSLYIDGQLDIELEGVESPNSNSENFEVGRWTGSATQYFNGLIDDVGIWNRRLDVSEILELYQSAPLVIGCTDSLACNFMPEANHDDGSCIGCSLFEERCGPGTMWDESVQLCVVANPSDTDFDSCVGMTDLLDLLSVFGTCNEIPWSCGDLLEYQGYDYETVQIGEQCWFAENLRSTTYENGDLIPSNLTNVEWQNTLSGAIASYEESASSLDTYGRLYNWYSVDDPRGLCPSGWHVPTDVEWTVMTGQLGGPTVAGLHMKTTFGWYNGGNGSNSSGFSGLPGGARSYNGSFVALTETGYWWSSTSGGVSAAGGVSAMFRKMNHTNEQVVQNSADSQRDGFSIRCISD